MPTTRRRRIVRRTVMALAGVGLLVGWVALLYAGWLLLASKPPEIERSRGVRLGMTPLEVDAVMEVQPTASNGTMDSGQIKMWGGAKPTGGLGSATFERVLLAPHDRHITYPVIVRFDKNLRVDWIKRGEEVEEAPQQQ
ncbi:MAG: hypothetical protein JNG89_07775 [Planctomycetaceae bacterium]|nr:hypothetical protein [Planctomycetaceae bacterium]